MPNPISPIPAPPPPRILHCLFPCTVPVTLVPPLPHSLAYYFIYYIVSLQSPTYGQQNSHPPSLPPNHSNPPKNAPNNSPLTAPIPLPTWQGSQVSFICPVLVSLNHIDLPCTKAPRYNSNVWVFSFTCKSPPYCCGRSGHQAKLGNCYHSA